MILAVRKVDVIGKIKTKKEQGNKDDPINFSF
jgi:hypothetical protein